MKLEVKMSIKLPSIPNFIIDDDGKSYPISFFSEVQLREIAKRWTDEFIKKGKSK